jgi:hypothetical protein
MREHSGDARETTYHNGYTHALHQSAESQQAGHDLPAGAAALHSARDDDAKAYQRGELHDNGEIEQEANGPPEVAERLSACHTPCI